MENYVTYNATDEELGTYGLNNPELTVEVNYKNTKNKETSDETYILHLSRNAEEKGKASVADILSGSYEADEEKDYSGYVRIGNSKIIYEISSSDYKTLMKASYNDLRHKELFTADFGTVTSIDISLEGKDYTLTSDKDDDIIKWTLGDKEVQIGEIETAIKALRATDFTDSKPTDKEEISIVLHLEHKNASELQIALHRQDGSNCIAVVNGEPTALVERSAIVDLIEAVNSIVLD